MKYTVNRIESGDDELILNYTEQTPEVDAVLMFMDKKQRKIIGRMGDEKVVVSPGDLLYAESIDNRTFVYTKDKVIQTDSTLSFLEAFLDDVQFFRCSKSMIINIYQIRRLKSLPGKRIDATMDNGEHVIISRHYSGELRSILRRDA